MAPHNELVNHFFEDSTKKITKIFVEDCLDWTSGECDYPSQRYYGGPSLPGGYGLPGELTYDTLTSMIKLLDVAAVLATVKPVALVEMPCCRMDELFDEIDVKYQVRTWQICRLMFACATVKGMSVRICGIGTKSRFGSFAVGERRRTTKLVGFHRERLCHGRCFDDLSVEGHRELGRLLGYQNANIEKWLRATRRLGVGGKTCR